MIKPGQSELLSVIVSCGKLKGQFTRAIQVSTNDPNNPVVQLMCRGQMLEAVHVTPAMVNFGRVPRKEVSPSRTAKITRGDGGPLKLKLKEIKNQAIQAELREVKAGEEYELKVTISPPFTAAYFRDKIELETGIEQSPVAEVSLYATVTPRVAAVPALVRIPPDAKPGWQQRITLQWDDNKPGRLLETSIHNPGIKTEIVELNDVQQVLLSVTDEYKPRMGRDNIIVKTDDPDMPQVLVQVMYQQATARTPQPARVAQPTRRVTPSDRKAPSTVPPSIRKPPQTTQPAPATAEGA
ncbi:MAG: hypothetical protein JXB13_03630 [Phycisphaerae bacterium]|nr:hypothetical protein [Phycisphaerae bacterium]